IRSASGRRYGFSLAVVLPGLEVRRLDAEAVDLQELIVEPRAEAVDLLADRGQRVDGVLRLDRLLVAAAHVHFAGDATPGLHADPGLPEPLDDGPDPAAGVCDQPRPGQVVEADERHR